MRSKVEKTDCYQVREILVRMLDAYGVDEKVRKERGIKTDDVSLIKAFTNLTRLTVRF